METDRKTAVIVGMLFILATAMGVTNAILLGPILQIAEPMQAVAENARTLRLSVLFNIIMAGSVIAIAVVLYPVLQRSHKTLAAGYLSARLVEGILLAITGMAWLGMLGAEASTIDLLISASTALFTLAAEITFGLTAIILGVVFFKAKLVPRWLSLWGLLGGGLISALGVLKILDLPFAAVEIAFTAPIALNEMVLAVWLIVKGFSKPILN